MKNIKNNLYITTILSVLFCFNVEIIYANNNPKDTIKTIKYYCDSLNLDTNKLLINGDPPGKLKSISAKINDTTYIYFCICNTLFVKKNSRVRKWEKQLVIKEIPCSVYLYYNNLTSIKPLHIANSYK